MKHENPTVNYVPRNPLWDIFMPRANASALHIITLPFLCRAFRLFVKAP